MRQVDWPARETVDERQALIPKLGSMTSGQAQGSGVQEPTHG